MGSMNNTFGKSQIAPRAIYCWPFHLPFRNQKIHRMLSLSTVAAIMQRSVTNIWAEGVSYLLCGKLLHTENTTILIFHTITCSPDSQ